MSASKRGKCGESHKLEVKELTGIKESVSARLDHD